MKKQTMNVLSRLVTANILGLVMAAMFVVGCQKENPEPAAQANEPTLEELEKKAPPPGTESIAEIAIAAEFNELVAALSYVDAELGAGLVDLFLNGTDQYTVFAPTDEAFGNLYSALGIGAITDLDAELVLDVLLYHVTEGRRAANSVVPPNKPRNINTLLGVSFSVNSSAQITAVGNTASIVLADISASNGIIHVIDAVILPIE